MADCRNNVIREMEVSLANHFPVEQVNLISGILTRVLSEYSVTELCTDLVPAETPNDKLISRYCACLFVDGKSDKTIHLYRHICKRFADFIGKPLTEVGVYEIRYFLACEKERGISNTTIENTRACISAFYQWMTAEEIIARNPCANVKPIKCQDIVRKPFSDTEIDALRTACKNEKERALIEVLLSTGVRVSELASMDMVDIDMNRQSVHVKHGKGGKERMTYITPVAITHLIAYWNERNYSGTAAFCNHSGDRLNAGGIRFILNTVGKRAKVANVHPHRFRRTFATGLANRGMDIREVQALLGHTDINTTMKYVCTDNQKVSASYRQYIA